ncbi:uncharacterized protein LOC144745823 [Ciona intestinalis]
MKAFAEENNIMTSPRRSLISSFKGEKQTFATPLLKWYLEHGLVITKVYEFISYEPQKCFESFGEFVCDARRAGDNDPTQAIIADCAKLIGNSAYGKTLTNKLKFKDVVFKREPLVNNMIKRKPFVHCDEIATDLYEIHMRKEHIRQDLPIQIGVFVYDLAKLKLLQFAYDVLFLFIDPSDITLVQCDTDSMYFGLSADSLDDVIKPELRKRFFTEYGTWFPALACDAHNAEFVETRTAFKAWVPI